ncbi:hypothetical protein [Streptomyces venezuelae]|uniref:hypothetical protein n=1 Tax=Streptomyces venezuelae TaxID=54571 RepID=UPI003656A3D1
MPETPTRMVPDSAARMIQRRKTARHARSHRRRGRLRRRLLAYRHIEILHSPALEARADSLLLVHSRRIVGHLTYRMCKRCASGVIVEIHVDAALQDSGLGTRAVSHLRTCYPDVKWRSCLAQRMTRDLAHRMRLPQSQTGQPCSHSQGPGPRRSLAPS